jgi:hypothetical protein
MWNLCEISMERNLEIQEFHFQDFMNWLPWLIEVYLFEEISKSSIGVKLLKSIDFHFGENTSVGLLFVKSESRTMCLAGVKGGEVMSLVLSPTPVLSPDILVVVGERLVWLRIEGERLFSCFGLLRPQRRTVVLWRNFIWIIAPYYSLAPAKPLRHTFNSNF